LRAYSDGKIRPDHYGSMPARLRRSPKCRRSSPHDEDMNALFLPMMSEEIAVCATSGELNAFIDAAQDFISRLPVGREAKRNITRRLTAASMGLK